MMFKILASVVLILRLNTVSSLTNCIPDPWLPDSVINSLNLTLACGHNITVSIDDCLLADMGFNLTNDIAIGSRQSGCLGTLVGGRLQFTISPLQACDGTFDINEVNNTISYQHHLRSISYTGLSNSNVGYLYNFTLSFNCTYSSRKVLTSVALMPIQQVQPDVNVTGSGSQNPTITIYQDDNFTMPYTANSFASLGTPVYATVCVQATELEVQVSKLWVTQSSDPADTNSLLLVNESCAVDESIQILNNYVMQCARFKVNVTTFTSQSDTLYMHATTTVCDRSVGACLVSAPNCSSGRRRRRRIAISDRIK